MCFVAVFISNICALLVARQLGHFIPKSACSHSFRTRLGSCGNRYLPAGNRPGKSCNRSRSRKRNYRFCRRTRGWSAGTNRHLCPWAAWPKGRTLAAQSTPTSRTLSLWIAKNEIKRVRIKISVVKQLFSVYSYDLTSFWPKIMWNSPSGIRIWEFWKPW